MKVGIYITGLGQSIENESVEKYAERLKNEISFHTTGKQYEIKTEKICYTTNRDSTVVSIIEKNNENNVIYKIYDFKYHKILTEKFNSYSLIKKNFWLLLLVTKKIPLVIKRLFNPHSYNRPIQTLYVCLIFLLIALSILFMIPGVLEIISKSAVSEAVFELKYLICKKDIPYISLEEIQKLSDNASPIIVSIIALLLLIVPNANVLIPNLATEFVCANNYMEHGAQRQLVQGNLELLVDYISENEKECKIHFHSYSFGSILALDYIFPFGNKLSKNADLYCEALITIGTPFEFINSYYPKFYQNRKTELGNKLHWLNVYSIADALATNFRNDSKIGESEFGIDNHSLKPTNLNYEVSHSNQSSITNFLMLHSIKVHGMYWDNNPEGLSCIRLIYDELNNKNLI